MSYIRPLFLKALCDLQGGLDVYQYFAEFLAVALLVASQNHLMPCFKAGEVEALLRCYRSEHCTSCFVWKRVCDLLAIVYWRPHGEEADAAPL